LRGTFEKEGQMREERGDAEVKHEVEKLRSAHESKRRKVELVHHITGRRRQEAAAS
jgi:hypothetical protein